MQSGPGILEPVQVRRIDAPIQYIGSITKLVQSRRGQMLDMQQEGESVVMTIKLPVAESFGFMSDLRSRTEGRGVLSLQDSRFERVPKELQNKVINQIRTRKGLKTNQNA